ncbi:hypothetical protein BV22DRAFT_1135336 [Leucogyrophana mollusca]|uniref:Uncharacterized protein n=1 Tax=Leucogyrophana mollusca TaxID=85980 RepID=A0ACB8AWG5_9AGAM|nr:hypothetical protein BV22DRAFT_1135336 [Leucogyrophana mollusca]
MPRTPSTPSTRRSRADASPYVRNSSPSKPLRTSTGAQSESISDVDVEPLLRAEVVRARQEAARLKAETAKAKRDLRQTQKDKKKIEEEKKKAVSSAEAAQSASDKFLAAWDIVLACPGCQATMEQPFTLGECGHTFCHSCLRMWFQRCVSRRLERTSNIPQHLKKPPYTAAQLTEIVQQKYLTYVWYTCPLCSKCIDAKPIETRFLKELVMAVSDVFGPITHNLGLDPWADSWIDADRL